MKGHPRPIEYGGRHYPTCTAFARAFGLDPRRAQERIESGIVDERLFHRYLLPRRSPLPPPTPTSPMYVRTYLNGWREWQV